MVKKVRNVTKSLAGMEDFQQLRGPHAQTRNGKAVTVHGMDVPYAVDSIAEMQALDLERFRHARVYSAPTTYVDYLYDPDNVTGVPVSDGGGSWLARIFEAPAQVNTIADLRIFEPDTAGQQIDLLGHTLPGLGDGKFYYDATDTDSSDNNGTTIVTTGGKRWKRLLTDFVTPEMFGLTGSGLDESAVFQASLDVAKSLGLDLLSSISCTISNTISVTSRVRHESRPTYDGSGLATNMDMFQLTGSNNGIGQVCLLGRYKIDMADAGRDAIYVRKGEHIDLGSGHVVDAGRAGINIEPFENFAWVENLVSDGFKCEGGVTWVRAKVDSFTATFINKVSMNQFEGRRCSGQPISILLNGPTSAHSIAEWLWTNPEFDTQSDADTVVYADRAVGALSRANSWTFMTPTFEDLRSIGSLPGGVAHAHIFGASEPNTFFSLAVIGGTRYQYNGVADANVIDGVRIYTGSGRLNVTPETGDYHSILGKTKIRRVLIDDGDTFRTNEGAVATLAGETQLSGVTQLLSSLQGGDSFYSAGQTKTIFTIGTDVVVSGVGQELHRISVLPVNALASSLYSEFVLYSHDADVGVKNAVTGDFSIAINGTAVELTNNNASGQSVRVRRLRLQ